MKISNKIGSFFAALIMLFACGVLARECNDNDVGTLSSHTLRTDENLICIDTRDDVIVISVYRNDGRDTPVAQNSILLEESDMSEGIVRLEPYSDGFQVYLEYPNIIYLVGFDSDAKHLIDSYVSIKSGVAALDLPPQKITLALSPQKLQSLKFESLTKGQAFDQNFLAIRQPLRTTVTAQRASISLLPKESSVSKEYLVLGESVEVIDYKSGWVKVNYEKSDHINDSGWILLSDIL